MDLVKFLEARIDEQEASLQARAFTEGPCASLVGDDIGFPQRLTEALLAEIAMKRRILEDWTTVAEADGIADPKDAGGPVALARRAMLLILAGGYSGHPDYQRRWEVRNDARAYSEPETGPTDIAKMPSPRAEVDAREGIPQIVPPPFRDVSRRF